MLTKKKNMIIPSRGTSSCFPIGMGYFCGSLKFLISNGVSSKWSSMWFFKHYLLLKMWIPTKTLLCSHITTRIAFKITIILGMFLRSPPNVCSLLFTLIQCLRHYYCQLLEVLTCLPLWVQTRKPCS